jgi:hypothetical protein
MITRDPHLTEYYATPRMRPLGRAHRPIRLRKRTWRRVAVFGVGIVAGVVWVVVRMWT